MTAFLGSPSPAEVAASPGEVLYVGRREDGEARVFVDTAGRGRENWSPLRHLVKHSPTGFDWGYGGSGPADLARSILADALGDDARCPVCAGRSLVVWLPDQDDPVPFDPAAHADLPNDIEAADSPEDDPAFVERCFDCDDGLRRDLPYQDFKFNVVADLPKDGWALARSAVLRWVAAFHRGPTS